MATTKSKPNAAPRGAGRSIEDVEAQAEAAARVLNSTFRYMENSPFERIAQRLNGVQALCDLASINHSQEAPATGEVMGNLWWLVRIVQEDIYRDLYELDATHYEVRRRLTEQQA